jgi:hypothetical protein
MANLMISTFKNCYLILLLFYYILYYLPIVVSNQAWRDERNKILGWKLQSFVSNYTKYFPCTKKSRQDKEKKKSSIYSWSRMYSFPISNTFFSPIVLLLISKKQQAKMKEWGTTQERMNKKKIKNIFHSHKFPITWKLQRHLIVQDKFLS